MALDKILIEDLHLRCIIGINDEERKNRQDVLINLTLYADISRAGETDSIDDAVNYRSVTKRIIEHVEGSSFFLVEALASTIARIVLTEFPVERVKVKVQKPGALRFSRSVGVEIERERHHFSL
ncbi:MAG: dihydroneopterin aldolase [Thermodesulfobacteriota bacterium]